LLVRDSAVFGPGAAKILAARVLGYQHVKVRLRGLGTVLLRLNDSDYWSFQQVFITGIYEISTTPQGQRLQSVYHRLLESGITPVIIDAGANVGAATLWFANAFPEAAIFAIEPERNTFAVCRQNTASRPNIRVIEGAIGARPGWVEVGSAAVSWSATTSRAEHGSIAIYTVPDIFEMAGPNRALFIVKVDIEGFEAELFEENTQWIADTFAIFVEPHDWIFPGKKTSYSMQKSLFGIGFELLVQHENIMLVRPESDLPPRSN
jgi:FkbM family methyltransferase